MFKVHVPSKINNHQVAIFYLSGETSEDTEYDEEESSTPNVSLYLCPFYVVFQISSFECFVILITLKSAFQFKRELYLFLIRTSITNISNANDLCLYTCLPSS